MGLAGLGFLLFIGNEGGNLGLKRMQGFARVAYGAQSLGRVWGSVN